MQIRMRFGTLSDYAYIMTKNEFLELILKKRGDKNNPLQFLCLKIILKFKNEHIHIFELAEHAFAFAFKNG